MPKERNKADGYREKAYEGDTKAMIIMNKKQSMKHLMIFTAGIIICSTMVLTSCR